MRKRRLRRNRNTKSNPFLYLEKILWSQGIEYIAGVDEVGLGALAGPVIASAVVFPKNIDFLNLKDSKKLTPQERESLFVEIKNTALFISIGKVDVKRINKLNNIYKAGLEAMKKSIYSLKVEPQHILVDGRRIPDIKTPQSKFNRGEDINFSIAAASIVAKVYRDNLMKRYSKIYPEYQFAQHKGYATTHHVEILKKIGPCEIHRISYEFVRGICGEFSQNYFKFYRKIIKAKCEKEIDLLNEDLTQLKKRVSQIEWKRLRRKITFKRNYLMAAIRKKPTKIGNHN